MSSSPTSETVSISEVVVAATAGTKTHELKIPPGFYESIYIYSYSYPSRYYQQAAVYDNLRSKFLLMLEAKNQQHINSPCIWVLKNFTISPDYHIRVNQSSRVVGDQIRIGVYASKSGGNK